MTLEEERNTRRAPEQNFPNVVLSGSPSMISTSSSLQLSLLEQWEGKTSAFGIMVPPAGSLPCPDPTQSQSFAHQTSQDGALGEGDSPFWRRGWWSPRTLPTPGLQLTPCLLGSPTAGAQGSPPRTLGSGATGRNSTVNPEDRFLGQQEWSQVRPRQGCVTPLLLHPLHPWHRGPRTPAWPPGSAEARGASSSPCCGQSAHTGCHTPAEVSASSSCPSDLTPPCLPLSASSMCPTQEGGWSLSGLKRDPEGTSHQDTHSASSRLACSWME